ncbi:hypothetical protein EYZ11_004831 [Aspergillus tanneri]|uniref:Uncharacterized protein n=1 Tax=Aspergillus tanneri TaxID=1220188 RepID=A0A4S3JJI4_9EURO|nr:hypothetical protein EYZ11_004831 [Aspergillus tanneri]
MRVRLGLHVDNTFEQVVPSSSKASSMF